MSMIECKILFICSILYLYVCSNNHLSFISNTKFSKHWLNTHSNQWISSFICRSEFSSKNIKIHL